MANYESHYDYNKYKAFSEWYTDNHEELQYKWLVKEQAKNGWQKSQLDDLALRAAEHNRVLSIADGIFLRIEQRPYGTPIDFPYDGNDPEQVSVYFDFKINGIFYDLNTPEDIFNNFDPEHPEIAAKEYLIWKAQELGLEDSNFVYQMLQRVPGFKKDFKPWFLLYRTDDEIKEFLAEMKSRRKVQIKDPTPFSNEEVEIPEEHNHTPHISYSESPNLSIENVSPINNWEEEKSGFPEPAEERKSSEKLPLFILLGILLFLILLIIILT